MAKKIELILKEYLEHLELQKGRHPLTARNYAFYLRRFFAETKISKPAQISLSKIEQFIDYLSRLKVGRELLHQSTQNYHLIALRSFLKFLHQQGFKKVPAPQEIKLTRVQRQKTILSSTALEKILAEPLKAKGSEIIKIRDKAISELLFSTDLKVSQIVALKIEAWDKTKGKLKILKPSLETEAIFLSNQAQYWLAKYLAKRHDQSPALFISHDRASGRRSKDDSLAGLTPRSIQRLIVKYAKLAGIQEKVTPEILRRSNG